MMRTSISICGNRQKAQTAAADAREPLRFIRAASRFQYAALAAFAEFYWAIKSFSTFFETIVFSRDSLILHG
jgi:nitroreductase